MAVLQVRKAAIMLMALDAESGSELLKSVAPTAVAELVAEVTKLTTEGYTMIKAQNELLEVLQISLSSKQISTSEQLQQMVVNALGAERSKKVLAQAEYISQNRDPFSTIRKAKVKSLAEVINGEPADIAALVISELPLSQSTQLLPLLDEGVREHIIQCLASEGEVPAGTKIRVAGIIQSRLEKMAIPVTAAPSDEEGDGEDEEIDPRQRHLRKIALLLRSLELIERTEMLKGLKESDAETADEIQNLMVAWEDVQKIEDRTMQEILRSVAPADLAVALKDADEITLANVRDNLSARVKEALDEESGFLSKVKKDDITKARESIIEIMRDLNSQNMLLFKDEDEDA